MSDNEIFSMPDNPFERATMIEQFLHVLDCQFCLDEAARIEGMAATELRLRLVKILKRVGN